MERVLRLLNGWGADPGSGVRRVMGDAEFYLHLVQAFVEKEDIAGLRKAVSTGEWEQAFLLSHSMKGASANLGLLPLNHVLSEIVEDLRGQAMLQNLPLHMELFEEQLAKLKILLREE